MNSPEWDLLKSARRVLLVGVGGSGMSGLATILLQMAKVVVGSDLAESSALQRLRRAGADIRAFHSAENVQDADLVIISAAIPNDNPELVVARQSGIPVLTHAEALGALLSQRTGIAVAGTHGKTTTTAMIAFILDRCGLDPSFLIGSEALDLGASARLGTGPHMVVEADEYDRRFLALRPHLAVITSIEPDHLDYYRDLAEIQSAFVEFAARVLPGGALITCADSPALADLTLPGSRITYGLSPAADWRISSYRPEAGGCRFVVEGPDHQRAEIALRLAGHHNASNALAATIACLVLGVDLTLTAEALQHFTGTRRRFETIGRYRGIWVVDDYAHHPTEVRATLRAARERHGGRIIVVFQPHTTNRTAKLLADFVSAFDNADRVVLVPIYQPAGRERQGLPVSSEDLAVRMPPHLIRLVSGLDEAMDVLKEEVAPGDLVITMGAGDVNKIGPELCRWLEAG